MKISLKPAEGSAFVFSLLPEKVQVKYASKYQSYDIISKGEVCVSKGVKAAGFSWEGEFFGKTKKNSAGVSRDDWREPSECVKILHSWMNTKTELTLIVSETWVNTDVTIESFEVSPHGGYGDVSYSISLKKLRSLKIYTAKESGIGVKKKTKARAKKKSGSSGKKASFYTVKKGETLNKIALVHGTTWIRVYNKNKSLIEQAAKKRGFQNSDMGSRIFPGTKLNIH